MSFNQANDDLQALLAGFAKLDILDRTWLRVAGDLLACSRRHAPSPAEWELGGGEPFTSREAMVTDFAEALMSVTSGIELPHVSEEQLRIVTDIAHTHVAFGVGALKAGTDAGTMLPYVVASSAAAAIDEVFAHTFRPTPPGVNTSLVVADKAFVVSPWDPRASVGNHGTNSNPTALPSRDLARTDHLRLGPRTSGGFEFEQYFDMWNRLSRVGVHLDGDDTEYDDLVVAVGQPNLTLAEYGITVDDGDDEIPATYTNRGPTDAVRQVELVFAQIVAAGERDVDVLLLPEYTLNEQAEETLLKRLGASLAPRPPVIVSGMCERDEEGNLVNRALIVAADGPGLAVGAHHLPRKLFGAPIPLPRPVPEDGDGAGAISDLDATEIRELVTYEEGIITGSKVTVVVSQRWCIAVVICRDLLNEHIVAQLCEMGVNLVLVPAMTPKTSSMSGSLAQFRLRTQAFGALSVGPARWVTRPDDPQGRLSRNRVEAGFDGPYAQDTGPLTAPSNGEKPSEDEVGMWVFSSRARSVTWVPVQAPP